MLTSLIVEPLVQIAVGVAMSAVAAVATQAWTWFRARIHGSRVDLVANAAARAAGEIFERVSSSPEGGAALEQMKEDLIWKSTSIISQIRLPDTVTKLGVSSETLAGMVRGELGRLLATGGVVK